jgi:hypothetical protein
MFVHIRHLRQRGLGTVEYVILLVLVVAVAAATWQFFGLRIKCALSQAHGEIDSQLSGTPNSFAAQCANLRGAQPTSRESTTFSSLNSERPSSANTGTPTIAASCSPGETPSSR